MSKLQLFVSGWRKIMGGYPEWNNRSKCVDINANCLGYENRQTGVSRSWIESMHRRDDGRTSSTVSSADEQSMECSGHGPEFAQSVQSHSADGFMGDLLGVNMGPGLIPIQGNTGMNWGQGSMPATLSGGPADNPYSRTDVAGPLDQGLVENESLERMEDVTAAIGNFLIGQRPNPGASGFSYSSPSCSYGNQNAGHNNPVFYPQHTTDTKQVSLVNNTGDYTQGYIDPCLDKKMPPDLSQSLGNSRHSYSEQTRFPPHKDSCSMLAQATQLMDLAPSYDSHNPLDTGVWAFQKDSCDQGQRPAGQMTGSDDTQSILGQGGVGLTAEPLTDSSTYDDLSDIEQLYNILMSPERSCDRTDETSLEEDIRLKRRREKNRVAAQKCREKKRDASNNLVKQYQELESSNTQIRYQIRQFQKEKLNLENILSSHLPECTKHCRTAASSTLVHAISTATRTQPTSSAGAPSHPAQRCSVEDHQPGTSPRMGKTSSVADHASILHQADSEQGEGSQPRLSTKRRSFGPDTRQLEEVKKARLLQSADNSMVIPTPILSHGGMPVSGRTSWHDSGWNVKNQRAYQEKNPSSAVDNLATVAASGTGPSLSLGQRNRTWSLNKDSERFVEPSVYPTKTSRVSSIQTVTPDSCQYNSRPQLLSTNTRLPSNPSQTSPLHKIPTKTDHVTPPKTDISSVTNQRPSGVLCGVQVPTCSMGGVQPLVLPPPKCNQPAEFPTYTRRHPQAVLKHPPPQTTSTLTSATHTDSLQAATHLGHLPQQVTRGPGRPKRGGSIDFNTQFNIPD